MFGHSPLCTSGLAATCPSDLRRLEHSAAPGLLARGYRDVVERGGVRDDGVCDIRALDRDVVRAGRLGDEASDRNRAVLVCDGWEVAKGVGAERRQSVVGTGAVADEQ